MRSRFVAALVAGMATLAVLGSVLYGAVFARLFAANVDAGIMKQPPALLWVGLAHLPSGLLLTLVVSWRGATSAAAGAVTGAILGFLMAASYDFSQYGTTNAWSLRLTLVEPLISAMLVGGAGAVVGLVLGWKSAGHQVKPAERAQY